MPFEGDRFYSEAASLVCIVLGRSCRIKTALYESGFKTDLRRLYALGCNTLNKYAFLLKILHTSGILLNSSGTVHVKKTNASSDACLQCSLCVLVHDLVLSAKRGAKHKLLMQSIGSLTRDSHVVKKIRQAYHSLKGQGNKKSVQSDFNQCCLTYSEIKLPCYARVNQLLSNLGEVLNELGSLGFEQRSHDPMKASYHRFLKRVKKLRPNQFMLDHHLPEELLVFAPGNKLHQSDICKSHRLVLQDKASCIPPKVLRPQYDGDALDACAAPGNKTLQLVSSLSSRATLFAVDRDPTRFRRLCSHLTACGVRRLSTDGPVTDASNASACGDVKQPRVEAICSDFLMLDPQDSRFSRVQSILLDPSCSGSGLNIRQPDGSADRSFDQRLNSNQFEDNRNSYDDMCQSEQPEQRLQRLSNLQAQLLRHAFAFPNVKRVVYSTCSVHPEENERVIAEMRDRFDDRFALEPIWLERSHIESTSPYNEQEGSYHPVWKHRGLSEFGCAPCIRASPMEDLTNGFFVACFYRLPVKSKVQECRRVCEYRDVFSLDAKCPRVISKRDQDKICSNGSRRKRKGRKKQK